MSITSHDGGDAQMAGQGVAGSAPSAGVAAGGVNCASCTACGTCNTNTFKSAVSPAGGTGGTAGKGADGTPGSGGDSYALVTVSSTLSDDGHTVLNIGSPGKGAPNGVAGTSLSL